MKVKLPVMVVKIISMALNVYLVNVIPLAVWDHVIQSQERVTAEGM